MFEVCLEDKQVSLLFWCVTSLPRAGGARVVSKDEMQMPPELRKALIDQRIAFVEKFGREPDPGEPIFFDPDREFPMPAPLSKIPAYVVEAMLKAGFDEAETKAFLRAVT